MPFECSNVTTLSGYCDQIPNFYGSRNLSKRVVFKKKRLYNPVPAIRIGNESSTNSKNFCVESPIIQTGFTNLFYLLIILSFIHILFIYSSHIHTKQNVKPILVQKFRARDSSLHRMLSKFISQTS